MSSFGDAVVAKCDTDEPGCCVLGAYMWTWPLGPTPPVMPPLLATTSPPVQCRSPGSLLAVTRSASVITG